ncbi:hypothetical protein TIFTF001_003388 [Ficus carica]|uniref:glucose-6-phosphate 1-epimerase n=1 Tax=Ficus carica TaxID=3494 RepID=A0AA88CRA3_FICCA|nr:hypothetical protein TIFTF001_003388 [Ficus carica]
MNSGATSSGDQSGGSVEVVKDRQGIDQVLLRSSGGFSARVSLYGGQVRSWMTDRGEELLFTSSKAVFRPPKAVRGGIQICFPQFAKSGTLEQHGFARNRLWVIEKNPPPFAVRTDSDGKAFVDLLLKPSDEDLKIWPHSFELRLRICLAPKGNLSLISRVRNMNCKPFSFSFAFHTYFSISDISEVRIEGLETQDYLDNLLQRERFTDQGNSLTFESEMDRVYINTSSKVAILDHEKKRTYIIMKEGLPDVELKQTNAHALCYHSVQNGRPLWILVALAKIWEVKVKPETSEVRLDICAYRITLNRRLRSDSVAKIMLTPFNQSVPTLGHMSMSTLVDYVPVSVMFDTLVWNPWERKSKAMADFGDDEYKRTLCVDGASVEKPITLKLGQEWTGRLDLFLRHSS